MSEKTMRKKLVKILRPLDAFAVETGAIKIGCPDINYCFGWIEAKYLKDFPKRASTPIRPRCYTKQQKVFSRRRAHAGGITWVMLQIKREWFLFDGVIAAEGLGTWSRQELHDKCLYHWTNGLNDKVVGILATMKWVS